MSLSANVAAAFPGPVRDRGRAYFRRGAVQITDGGPASVRATVAGTRTYSVSLWLNGDSLGVSCTCPRFRGASDPCQHIWATVLAAEAGRHLGGSRDSGATALASEDPSFRWRHQLAGIGGALQGVTGSNGWPQGKELAYVLDGPASLEAGALIVEINQRKKRKNGSWGHLRTHRLALRQLEHLPEHDDRRILSLLLGARSGDEPGEGRPYDQAPARFRLPGALQQTLVPMMCATGRCRLRRRVEAADPEPLPWLEGDPWQLWLELRLLRAAGRVRLRGSLRRGAERRAVDDPALVLPGGLVFFAHGVAPLEGTGTYDWIEQLRGQGHVEVPLDQLDELLAELAALPTLPLLELPRELGLRQLAPEPRPRLQLSPVRGGWAKKPLKAELFFDYGGTTLSEGDRRSAAYRPEDKTLVRRSPAPEGTAAQRLDALGVRSSARSGWGRLPARELASAQLAPVLRALTNEGWRVEVGGREQRPPGALHAEVSSGIDWFDLQGHVSFGDSSAPLTKVLAALRRGEVSVPLEDGSQGVLPEGWLKEYVVLAGLGASDGQRVRFSGSQIGLLDALLDALPEVRLDDAFRKARQRLGEFSGIAPRDPSPEFTGQLRGYQRDGLAWLLFLEEFGFGGCLADDMGLGKTVQVLALLDARRHEGRGQNPSLVVVPRSIVFNWKEEARRFAPALRVLDHTGLGRAKTSDAFEGFDLVVTTYGTLRRDVLLLKDVPFDYAILDEAQAIKNPRTGAAKASRLLRARHRLALSGTPIENHLGELWSLFEFLNPGMLGSSPLFRAGTTSLDEGDRQVLGRALRPFILRRTKDRVAPELPAKLEQTLYCELESKQRQLYDQLREHYRGALVQAMEERGLKKSKLLVLEALLRLRQAACHPGLIDQERAGDPAAKLDMLVPQLTEVLDEGHKALVFSQFTSLLSLLRTRLDELGVPYEYLDGRTRDRASRVRRFQEGKGASVFLVSLKAGGLGLNLTAAEYVFLLDPWWNPAVEAQAIDRTHRIGQRRRVFAYRLIARDTVEEKVLDLQRTKQNLAEAILTADNSLIRDLGREDLELLLS